MFDRFSARTSPSILVQDEPENIRLEGSGRNDTLSGGDGSDTLFGRGGDDVLGDGAGDDLLVGGPGEDRLIGGAGANTLVGGAGDDTLSGGGLLDGGEGADLFYGSGTLRGGGGDDWYSGPGSSAVIEEEAGGGIDTVEWQGGDYRLPQNVENLIHLLTIGSDIVGNRLANSMIAVPLYDAVGPNLFGEAGNDQLAGGGYRIEGGAGDDALYSYGAGTVAGGAGDDQLVVVTTAGDLIGGKGADRFLAASEGPAWGAIADFDAGEGDVIDLGAIDADSSVDGDQAFVFVRVFSGAARQARLVYDRALDETRLELDVNGDGAPDFDALIDGHARAGDGWAL